MTHHRDASCLAICTLLVVVLGAQTDRFAIDPAASEVLIRIGKAGLFAFAGHEHEVAAPALAGEVIVDQADIARSRVALEFDATALKVTGRGEPPEDVPEVQRIMVSERVLDVRQYPKIVFQSRRVSLAGKTASRLDLRVAGDLTLHGTTRPLTIPVEVRFNADGLIATGSTTVRQTDFGLKPMTAGAGTVRVKDEVEVVFQIVARRR